MRDEAVAAVRRIGRHPRHATGLALILAVCTGSAIGIFHVGYEDLHRPLPYRHVNRLVVVPHAAAAHMLISDYPPYAPNPSLHSVFAEAGKYLYDTERIEFASQPRQIVIARVTPHFFSTLGVRPAVGQFWSTRFRPPYPPAGVSWLPIVISFHLWRSYFGADPRVVGAELRAEGVNSQQYQIIGVAPDGVAFPPGADAWAPAGIYSFTLIQSPAPGALGGGVVGLLRPGLSVQAAAAITAAWTTRRDPLWYYPRGPIRLVTIGRFLAGDVPQLAQVLWLSTLLLLALATLAAIGIACSDIQRRRGELEIKGMVGASVGRLQLSLGIELGIVLVVSLVGAFAVRDLLVATAERYFLLTLSVSLGWREIAMAVAPALIVLAATLVRQRRVLTRLVSARHRALVRISPRWVVTAVILVAASLLAESGYRLVHSKLGLDPHHVFVCELSLPERRSSYSSPDGALKPRQSPKAETKQNNQQGMLRRDATLDASYSNLVARLRKSPLISRAGLISISPYSGRAPYTAGMAQITQNPGPCGRAGGGAGVYAAARNVSSGVIRALGMTIHYGRGFDASSDTVPGRAVVVNDALASHFGGKAALGGYLCLGTLNRRGYQVIAIVQNVHEASVFSPPMPTVYYPLTKYPSTLMSLVVRTSSDASSGTVLSVIRDAMRTVAPGTVVLDFRSLDSMIHSAESENIYAAIYLLAMAVISIILAGASAWVESADACLRRRHEVGIRMALGATPRSVIWLMARTAMISGAFSVAIGGLVAWWFVRLFGHLVFGVGFLEPLLYLSATLALISYLAVVHAISVRKSLGRNPAELLAHE